MSKFFNYFKNYGTQINIEFQRARQSFSDSSVKGANNEKIIAKFLKDHVPMWFVSTNSQIIDFNDKISDEVDVCACNQYQIFRQEHNGLLIAEGIDFVVQVKAVLTSDEITKIYKNCQSVKQLERTFNSNDQTIDIGVPYESFSKIPYIVFAFSSHIKADTLHDQLENKKQLISFINQPDAIFVLDKGLSFINCKNSQISTWKSGEQPIVGWSKLGSGEMTLMEMIKFINTKVPRFHRLISPIVKYFP